MLVVKNKKSPHACYDGRWNNQYAFHPLLMNDLQRFFGSDAQSEMPKVNIIEDEHGYTIELAAPGVAKEDLKIDMDGALLTISSESKKDSSTNTQSEEKMPKFLKKEFSYHGFKRSFKMPENIDTAGIKASYSNGILNVVLPKKDKSGEGDSKTIAIS